MKCSKLFDYFKRNVILNGFSVTVTVTVTVQRERKENDAALVGVCKTN